MQTAIDSSYLQSLYRYENIKHLLDQGILVFLPYDTERTGLKRLFGAITEFDSAVITVDGRILDIAEVYARVPRHVPVSPQAALITEQFPEDLYKKEGRDSPHIAIGKMIEFLRNPHRRLWDALADTSEIITKANGEELEARYYRVPTDDGGERVFRLHNYGKIVAERVTNRNIANHTDPDGSLWKETAFSANTFGHNNINADDPWIWVAAFMQGHRDIFVTHVRKYRRFRTDTRAKAEMLYLLNDQGENGLQPGRGTNSKTGESYLAFSLPSLMAANTRRAIAERGISEGVHMHDGSLYDSKRAHNGRYDMLATAAWDFYMRSVDPETCRAIDNNFDFLTVKKFLRGEHFNNHRLISFARRAFPGGPRLHTGVCLGIDEDVIERRQAILLRTDLGDLSQYRFQYNGEARLLSELDADGWARLLAEQKGRPDAIFQIISLRKTPPLVPAELAAARGKIKDLAQQNDNALFVAANPHMGRNAIEGLLRCSPPIEGADKLLNPQVEEELFTGIAELKRYNIKKPDGTKVLISQTIHEKAFDVFKNGRDIDGCYHKLVEPDPVEWRSDLDTLTEFTDKVKKMRRDLARYMNLDSGVGILPEPDLPYDLKQVVKLIKKSSAIFDRDLAFDEDGEPTQALIDFCTANAVEYLWQLRDALMYEFHDYSLSYKILDRYGHEIDFADLIAIREEDCESRLKAGEYSIAFERLDYTPEILAGMFDEGGRIPWAKSRAKNKALAGDEAAQIRLEEWEHWERFLDARVALRNHGAPHEDHDACRWDSEIKNLKDVERLCFNFARDRDFRADEEEIGLREKFLSLGEKADAILANSKKISKRRLREMPLTPERMRLMGYDPEARGYPFERPKYQIEAEARRIIIDVPDRMLDEPFSHPRLAEKFLMIAPPEGINLREEMLDGAQGLLRGNESGRVFYAPKATLLDTIAPTPFYREVYNKAKVQFADSGFPYPEKDSELLCLAVQELAPLTNWRPVNEKLQTIKIPRWEDFMGTVSPLLGHRHEILTGLVLRDYGTKLKPGKARLQGLMPVAGKKSELIESGWEVAAYIQSVRSYTLIEVKEAVRRTRKLARAAALLDLKNLEMLFAKLSDGEVTPAMAKEAGYRAPLQMEEEAVKLIFPPKVVRAYGFNTLDEIDGLSDLFARQDIRPDDPGNILHFVIIRPVDKDTMTYLNPQTRPRALFMRHAYPKAKPSVLELG